MKPNLSNKIGICISHWPLEPIEWWLKAGCRHFRIGIEWAVFNPNPGYYVFNVADAAFRMIADAGGKILVHLFMVPSYLYPEYPRILNHPFAIPIFREEWVIEWVDYVRRFLEWSEQFGDAIEVCGPIVESNLPGWWERERTLQEIKDGKPKQEASPEDFIMLVLRPVAPLIRFSGKKVIGGTVTLQGERSWTYNRALKYFDHYRNRNFGTLNHMDFHVYRDVGKDTVSDIKRFIRDAEIKHPVWISELGFNEKGGFTFWETFWRKISGKDDYTGEMRQERKYKQLLEFLESTKPEDREFLDKIKRIYLYRGHAGDREPNSDELLNPPTEQVKEWTPKKAGALIREYLQG
jgi:hypothetical protein